MDLINITTSAIRSTADLLRDLHGIELTKLPSVYRERVTRPKVIGVDSDYITLTTLAHDASMSTGYIIMFIAKDMAWDLLKQSGVAEPSKQQILEYCANFCAKIGEGFKSQLQRIGFTDIRTGVPKIFLDGANEDISGTFVDEKYILKFEKLNRTLFELHVAFESLI